MKMEKLVIHTTDTQYNQEKYPDDIFKWHLGMKPMPTGMYIFLGEQLTKDEMLKKKLTLPSGNVIPVSATNGRGWKKPGYSDMIQRSGKVLNLVPYNNDDVIDMNEITNGATGYNSFSRHVVLVGGWTKDSNKTGKDKTGKLLLPTDLYTVEQIESLIAYIKKQKQFVPNLKIIGHNEISEKTCPNFDVQLFLKSHSLI